MRSSILCLALLTMLPFTWTACHNGGKEKTSASDSTAVKQDTVAQNQNIDLAPPPDPDYTGDYSAKYSNGIVKFKGYFRFGKRHGQWLAFYLNGEKWSECFYDKGIKEGASNVYYPNGKPQLSGWYRNDLRDSVWTFYDTTGVVSEVHYFKNDQEIAAPARPK